LSIQAIVGEWLVSSARQQRDWIVSREQNPNREKARATRARQRAIGRELRRMYDDIVQEAVPDDFVDILRRIDDAEDSGTKSS
jgi:hypothetical protein